MEGWVPAVLAAVILGGGLIFERWVVPVLRPAWYLGIGVPLGEHLVPIDKVPEGTGETATVAWEARDLRVYFWASARGRRVPFGLHGVVSLQRRVDGRVDLDVRWSPPWVALVAILWLAVLGVLRGESYIGAPISAILLVAILLVYRQAAIRAAAELRFALISAEE
ncbi:MAG: hypothetical protein ACJAZO_005043 [Myxococcota bacterium]|jgi:hypothetical protein